MATAIRLAPSAAAMLRGELRSKRPISRSNTKKRKAMDVTAAPAVSRPGVMETPRICATAQRVTESRAKLATKSRINVSRYTLTKGSTPLDMSILR